MSFTVVFALQGFGEVTGYLDTADFGNDTVLTDFAISRSE